MTDLMTHALHYTGTMGWHVFPAPPGEKKSYFSAEFSDGRKWGATNNADEIQGIVEAYPGANLGVVTGVDSGIFVVEADTTEGHAVDGIAALAALEAENGALPPTLEAESPSGSVHRYFRHPGFPVKNSASALAPGVDVRGDGGMVIAPPSIKPGKGTYRWRNQCQIAEAPTWLLALVRGSERKASAEQSARAAPSGLRPADGSHAAQVLRSACEAVAAAEPGTRNAALNESAFLVGRYVASAEIGRDVAFADLLNACDECGLTSEDGEDACLATINSGLSGGAKVPVRTAEDMFRDVPVLVSPPLAPAAPAVSAAPRYLFETVADLRKLPANRWLVDKWIPEEGVGMIYGEYAHGKSFVGFDLLLHLAYGLPEWHGAKLPGECCDVLLVAREGGKGFQGRVDAFKAHHKITEDTERLWFMRSPANLGDAAQFEELKAAVAATGKQFKVVMVDTVGRALPGEDFFDPKSITGFMERLQQLGEVGRGVAVGVHHVNKSGDLFGSIYFGASSDFMFLVEREGDPKNDPLVRGKITCTKMKDGEDGWKRRVDYQKSENSLVIASITESTGMLGGETKKLSADDQLALQALVEAIQAKGQSRTGMPGLSVTIDEWLDRCFTIGGVDPTAAKPKRDLHRRQVKLLANGLIFVQEHLVRLVGHHAAAAGRPTVGQPIVPMPPFPTPSF